MTEFKRAKMARSGRAILKKSYAYILLTLGVITMILPFLWMLSTSLKPYSSIFALNISDVQWIPKPVYWKNYLDVWKVVPFARFYLNSLLVMVCVTVFQVATSALAAYSFSRLRFPGRDKLFFAYLATMMIPGSVTIVPAFILMRIFGWVDTYWALILPAAFTAYGTFLLRQFFMTIPRDLEDAAKIDGCSLLGIFKNVILPLSKTSIATLATFVALGNWASFMWPLLVTNSTEMATLPVGLAYFQELYQHAQPDFGLLMAGAIVTTIPIIIVFVFNQRFFVEGVKLTGMKG
ncbi:MAG: carbohydrate ABC transporter permease [Candidatus Omnitrophota bacterium]